MDDKKVVEEAQEAYLEEYARNGNLRKAFTTALAVTRKAITEERDRQWELAIYGESWPGQSFYSWIDRVRARLAPEETEQDDPLKDLLRNDWGDCAYSEIVNKHIREAYKRGRQQAERGREA